MAPLGKKRGETGKPSLHLKKLSFLGKKLHKILVSQEVFLNKCDYEHLITEHIFQESFLLFLRYYGHQRECCR